MMNSGQRAVKFLDSLLFHFLLIATVLASVILLIVSKSQSFTFVTRDTWLYSYTIIITTFQLSRLFGAMLYSRAKKTLAAEADALGPAFYEPFVSFIIPCKNEEKEITNTVEQCFAADYPREKKEVIVINDGSTDGTYFKLLSLKRRYPGLKVIHWHRNRGKRRAMAEGFRQATGDIIVQLDSDSFIRPATFRRLIEPFRHPEVGAVCAHSYPANADKNWLTRTQAAYYFVAFRVLKAAESSFTAVFCCSGCCSAYRRSLIMPILKPWLSERFLGKPITWGDDRSLTNWVLKQGAKTVYTDEVEAFTFCPETLGQFVKQQVRWKKGWFVNSMLASRFIIRRDPFVAFTYFFPLILITLATPFMAARAVLFNPLVKGIAPWPYLFSVFLVAVLITSYYRFLSRSNKYWPYVFAWSALNMVILSYILIFALATIQNRRWGTR